MNEVGITTWGYGALFCIFLQPLVWWSDSRGSNDTMYSRHPVMVSSQQQLWMAFAPSGLVILQVINKSNDSGMSSFKILRDAVAYLAAYLLTYWFTYQILPLCSLSTHHPRPGHHRLSSGRPQWPPHRSASVILAYSYLFICTLNYWRGNLKWES